MPDRAPPSVPPPRRPGLARCSPERLERDVRAATIVRRWASRLHVPVAELAEAFGVSERAARDLLACERPLHLGDLLALPRPYALRLLDELRGELLDPTGTEHR